MKVNILFVAMSLMLVGATIAVAIQNTVEAEKPRQLWCTTDNAACGASKQACQDDLGFIEGLHKCKRIA